MSMRSLRQLTVAVVFGALVAVTATEQAVGAITPDPPAATAPDTPDQQGGTAEGRSSETGVSAEKDPSGSDSGAGAEHTPGKGELPLDGASDDPVALPQTSPSRTTAAVGQTQEIPESAGPDRKDDLPAAADSPPDSSVAPSAASQAEAGLASPAEAAAAVGDGDGTVADTPAGAVEVVAERTADGAVFKNPDGTYTARMYATNVHYPMGDGTWERIDTTLVRGADGRWTQQANVSSPSFAATSADPAVVTHGTDPSAQVSFGVQGANNVDAVVDGNRVTYPGVLPGADVTFTAGATEVKETVVLRDSDAPTTWIYPLRITGLTPAVDAEGAVTFTDPAGLVRMTIPHGYMEDSAVDPESGQGAFSDKVTYALTTVDGAPALQVSIDPAWLKDPARVFPVRVDPTTSVSPGATASTYVESPNNLNYRTSLLMKVGSYDGGKHKAAGYLQFGSIPTSLNNAWIVEATLWMYNVYSSSCTNQTVSVAPITSPWNINTIKYYPGLSIGGAIGWNTFHAGTNCPGKPPEWMSVNLGVNATAAGSKLINGWTHGAPNLGLAVTADNAGFKGRKEFASASSLNPPYLSIKYSQYGAEYQPANTYVQPTASLQGTQNVTVTNKGQQAWGVGQIELTSNIYNTNWDLVTLNTPRISVPSTVQPRGTVTIAGKIPALAPAEYWVCWTMIAPGAQRFSDEYGVPLSPCTLIRSGNTPPQVTSASPPSNVTMGTLTPLLSASGFDPDNYPWGGAVDFHFRLFDSKTNTLVAERAYALDRNWQVPSGLLKWGQAYHWDVRSGDGESGSAWSNPSTFTTAVDQPLVTSHMGGSVGDSSGKTFDPQVGNYTTSATDAQVAVAGPPLTIARTYNSLDPRTDTLFGTGWSTPYDMSVTPDQDGTSNVVVRYADGRHVRFGTNPDGTFVAPPGQYATLKSVGASGYTLTDTAGNTYAFARQVGASWRLTKVTDREARIATLTYNTDGTLSKVANATSQRNLHFEWDTTANHVNKVSTDPAVGTDPNTVSSWSYTYNGDRLTQVCPPATSGCATYTYTAGTASGSHFRSTVVDANPASYWRLGDAPGAQFGVDQVLRNQSVTQAGLHNVTLGAAGALPGSPATSASFNGTTSWVRLPDGMTSKSNWLTVSLMFKTSTPGVLFSTGNDLPTNTNGTGGAMPVLYVGSDGKLYGHFWNDQPNGIVTSGSVTDNQWHHVVLSGSGTTQTMYVDGVAVGTQTGTIGNFDPWVFVGAGLLNSRPWPAQPAANWSFFKGQIAEVALYNRPVGSTAVATQWAAGSRAAYELTSAKLPSGKTQLGVTYDAVNDRAGTFTDADGGTWEIGVPEYNGSSSPIYRSEVLKNGPQNYWRLSDGAGAEAVDETWHAPPRPAVGTYHNVTLGSPGPLVSGPTKSPSFNGTSSYARLPDNAVFGAKQLSLSLWFKTTQPGVILSTAHQPPTAGSTPGGAMPVLYVGTDGKLYGHFWNGQVAGIATTAAVNDGAWHSVVLAASTTDQTLYVDGVAVGTQAGGMTNADPIATLGAGYLGTRAWPAEPDNGWGYFEGQIAEVSRYSYPLSAGQAAEFNTTGRTVPPEGTATETYRAAVLDARPDAYWRLGESSGYQMTEEVGSEALTANRGTYAGATLGEAGPLNSPLSKAAKLSGNGSYVQLPGNAAPSGDPSTIEMWFKATGPGVLYSYQATPLGSAPNDCNPALYIGSDNKLHGGFGTPDHTVDSPAAVTDGQWHYAVLTADGNVARLYLDGEEVSSYNGNLYFDGKGYAYLGAGATAGCAMAWPQAPTGDGNLPGTIAEFALYDYALDSDQVDAHHRVATSVSTDNQNADAAYRTAVVTSRPKAYWRLNDAGGTSAADQLGSLPPSTTNGIRNNMSSVLPGPNGDGAASFNGTNSYIQLPSSAAPRAGAAGIELWFKTQSPGVLYSYQDFPLDNAHTSIDNWNPALYIGEEGKLYGRFWGASQLVSPTVVTDNKWHQVALVSNGSSQKLYLDGKPVAGPVSGTLRYNGGAYVYLGAGTADNWPKAPPNSFYKGLMADVSYYNTALTDADVLSHYLKSGATSTEGPPVTAVRVTDPEDRTITYRYDPRYQGRAVSVTNQLGKATSYAYDTGGFLVAVTNPNGHTTRTGRDSRGNAVSTTTCRQAGDCQTSYATYPAVGAHPEGDVRNNLPLTVSDARSSGPDDRTYTTTYTYSQWGERLTATTPATADFPGGRTSLSVFSAGTEPAVGGGTTPKGLLTWSRDVSGQAVSYAYYKNGDLAHSTAPNGLRTSYTYDNLGRPKTSTQISDAYPSGVTTVVDYDKANRVTAATEPATVNAVTGVTHTPQTTNTYDADGNTLTTTVSDLTGGDAARTTTWTYNTYGQIATVTDAEDRQTSYTYDGFGRVATTTDPLGTELRHAYTPAGQLATTTLTNHTGDPVAPHDAKPVVLESRAYDPAGRLATVTDAMGRTKHMYYNDDNTLAEVDADAFRNADGSLRTIVLEQTYYDGAGNVVRRVTGGGKTTATATYDAAGRTTSSTLDPGGLDRVAKYTYDAADRPTTVRRSGGGVTEQVDFTYDSVGNTTSQTVRTGTASGAAGPLGWWKLNETSGHTAADATGRQAASLSGTGVTWSTEHGGSLAFDGNGVAATPSAVVDTTKSFSVTAWAKITDTTVRRTVVGQDGGNSSGFVLKYSSIAGKWMFSRGSTDSASATWTDAVSGSAVQADVWTHLAGVYDASTGKIKLYVNGVFQSEAAFTTPWQANGPLSIGRAKSDLDKFKGGISDVEAYGRALSAAEIQSVMTNPGLTQTAPGLTTSYSYDQRGLMKSVTDPRGNVAGAASADFTSQFVYDQAGQQTQVISPTVASEVGGGAPQNVHPITLTGYNAFGEVNAIDDAAGNITSFTYNKVGQQTAVSQPVYTAPGTSTPITPTGTRAYDDAGRLLTQTDPLGKTTEFTYDQFGNLTRSQLPAVGGTTPTWRFTYDLVGEQLSATDPTGARTEQTYDDLGRPVTNTQIVRQPTPQAHTATFAYDDASNPVSTRSPGGSVTSTTYNAAGEPETMTDPLGRKVTTTYDLSGRPLRTTLPDQTSTSNKYDLAGNRTETSEHNAAGAVLATTKFGHDPAGLLTSVTDPGNVTSTFTYNAMGNRVSQSEPVTATSSITVTFGYDVLGRNTRYTDGNGNPTLYAYNSLGLPESSTVPAVAGFTAVGDRSTVTSYDASSRPTKVVRPGGVVVNSGYDDLGRLTSQTGSGAEVATADRSFGYDLMGRLTSASTPTAPNTYTYDDRGSLLAATGPGGNANLTYTADGDLATRTDQAGQATFTWDAAGQLDTAYEPQTGTSLDYGYDLTGQVTSIDYGTGSKRSLTYDDRHQLASDTLRAPGGAIQAQLTYDRDLNGRITTRTTTGLAGAGTQTYTYDQAGRLSSFDDGTAETAYGYDNAGNRVSAGGVTASYNERNQLTSAGGNTYTYNARGGQSTRTTGGITRTSTFDAFDQLTAAGTSSYTYDALGRMTTAPGKSFTYTGSSTAVVGDGIETYSRGPSGSLTAVRTGTNPAALALTNPRGDLLGTFTADGSGLAGSTDYDPWGAVRGTTGTTRDLGYQGQFTDPSTGQVNMNARWYDPSTAAFTSADTIAQPPNPSINANPYTYANANPLENADPTGHAAVRCYGTPLGKPSAGPSPGQMTYRGLASLSLGRGFGSTSYAYQPPTFVVGGVNPQIRLLNVPTFYGVIDKPPTKSTGRLAWEGVEYVTGGRVDLSRNRWVTGATTVFVDSQSRGATRVVGRVAQGGKPWTKDDFRLAGPESAFWCDVSKTVPPPPPTPSQAANDPVRGPIGNGSGPVQNGVGVSPNARPQNTSANATPNPDNTPADPLVPQTIGNCSILGGRDARQDCSVGEELPGLPDPSVRLAECAGRSGTGLLCPTTASLAGETAVPGLSKPWTSAERLLIEDALGGNLVPGFPYIDTWHKETGIGTSVKTIDWRADTYRVSFSSITSMGKQQVKDLLNFKRNGASMGDLTIAPEDINGLVLRIGYPTGVNPAQLQAYLRIVAFGSESGVAVHLHPISEESGDG